VPAIPVVGIPVQVSWSVEGGGLTINVPLQVAVLPVQSPEFAATDMFEYVFATGVVQFGAFVQVRPLLTTVLLHLTVGGVIAEPALPVEGTASQASVYVTELLLGTFEPGTILTLLQLSIMFPEPQFATTVMSV